MGRLDHLDSKRDHYSLTGESQSACCSGKLSKANRKSANLDKDVSSRMTWINQRKRGLLIASLLLLAASTAVSQQVDRPTSQSNRSLQLLVMGDSILWGQGLKTEDKTWHHVKVWLEKNTGQHVFERIEAHSGAVIDRDSLTDNLASSNPEVNVGLPTINDQSTAHSVFIPIRLQLISCYLAAAETT